ncbi:hypothetical protein B0H34DRAFT_676059 [Crassisporium funariophilum]|nr:hypothetical protein B0H34DRAFT_676059 [Crassisporium funariophilum]
MGGQRWTTDEELAWLQSKLPLYHESKRRDRVSRFFTSLIEEWFQKWPEEGRVFPDIDKGELDADQKVKVAKAVKKRKEQLRSWMMRSVVKETRSTASDFKQLMQVVKKGQPRKRALQRVEVYQKHFGDKKKIAAVVEEAMKNATEEDTAMGIRRRVVAKLLDEEPPDVQAKVNAKAEELKGQRQAEVETLKNMENNEEAGAARTPSQYHEAIKSLPAMLSAAIRSLADATGWVFFITAGGPNPDAHGSIFMESFYFGRTSAVGNDFQDAYLAFEENVQDPFGKHVSNCFRMYPYTSLV